jgi:hypothetical protein
MSLEQRHSGLAYTLSGLRQIYIEPRRPPAQEYRLRLKRP